MNISAPTLEDFREHALTLKLNLSDDELEAYRALMEPSIDLYRILDDAEDTVLHPKYPRGSVVRPDTAENPLNGWASKVEVKGADSGPLAGRTVVLKDNICLAGAPMLNGAQAMEGYVPESDATVVTRVLDAGGTIIGKAHCEYLCTSGGSHSGSWGAVRNPHKPAHSSGGSSSGCGVLVATGEADMAIGCDQGGSIRIPASYCGIVGMKPTHGLVPYTGMGAIEATMDHTGPMTKNVTDNALLLSVLAGADGLDPRQRAPIVKDYLADIEGCVKGMRIGLVTEGFTMPNAEEDISANVRKAAKEFSELGAVVEEVSIPMHAISAAVWMPITMEGAVRSMFYSHGLPTLPRSFYPVDLLDYMSEHSDILGGLPGPTKALLLLGEHMHSRYHGRYYAKAQNQVQRAIAAYDAALSNYDVLVMPTAPMKPQELPDEDASLETLSKCAFDPLINTAIFDATGHPALSMPCGMSDGLPVGLMMIGKHYDEPTIYRVARALEKHLAIDLVPGVVQEK